MADPELTSPDKLYAPPGSFLAGERILDDNPVQAPSNFNDRYKPATPAGVVSPISELQQTDMAHDLGDVTRRQMDERGRVENTATGYMNEDRQRMVSAYQAEGIGPNDLRPLELDKIEQQHRHSPVEAFGSLGAVFAMVASAFTHQPMTNSLNAGAAALNAIKQGDEKEIDRHIDEWKENTTLALKRQAIQHQQYTDSISLADTDMRSAEAKLRMQAARFGDEKLLVLLDKYGMSKEVMDLVTARNNQATSLARATEEMNKATLQSAVIRNDPDINSGDPARMERAFQRIYGKEPTPEQQAIRQLWEEKAATIDPATGQPGKPTSEDIIGVHQKMQRISQSTGTTPAAQAARIAREASENPDSPFFGKYDDALMDVNKRIAASKTALTANKRVQLESHVAQYDVADKLIGSVEDVLNKYVGAAGVAGKATRLAERISNLAGSNKTDRVQMMRNIEELQLLAPRLLLDQSTGRPLSAEAGHINAIIAGLAGGDTTANTLRAMKEIKQQLKTMQQTNKDILKNESSGPAGPGAKKETPAEAPEGDWWKGAPLKKGE